MIIRTATSEDAPEGSNVLRRSIAELCSADHEDNAEAIRVWIANKTPDSWRAWVNQTSSSVYVAVEDEQIVGVGMMSHQGEIMLNYVSPDYRLRGVSKSLLSHMEGEARKLGLEECRLESTKTACRFYEAAG